ncbi:adenine nucleotide alpha hydrolase [Vicingus serpentipes]|uniref:Adenine nucleotide alpha hydrolase n=1 Tax=Vicingus serpentipes TaxID=1926625 RepID=A0A5C6RV04_9FLAO|nr:adenine nucleotide alpha hydrolase [Vicingus serpentipes]TXB65884.1 adenine nucleotide alpha hydrolase [Vicingus serpentipes]
MTKEKIIMSWSGGKDSSMALHKLLLDAQYEVKYLLTTIYKPNGRVSMHGVPEALIKEQAKAIGIPLKIIYIEEKTHDEYEIKMRAFLEEMKAEGIQKVAFGDIFLEDLKKYREDKLTEVEMEGVFPLWKIKTTEMAQYFIDNHFKTHICAIDNSKIPTHLIANNYNQTFLDSLPADVDPCGENGEFHTFCYDGPIFKTPVKFKVNTPTLKTYEHDGKTYEYTFSDLESVI